MGLRAKFSPSNFDTQHSFEDIRHCSPQQILKRFYDHCSQTSKHNIKSTPLSNAHYLREKISTLPLSAEQKVEGLSLIIFNHQRDAYPFAPIDREGLITTLTQENYLADSNIITQALINSRQEDILSKKNHTTGHESLVPTWAPADILKHFSSHVEPNVYKRFHSPKNKTKRRLYTLLTKNTNEHSFAIQEDIHFRSEIIHALFNFVVGHKTDSPETLNTFVEVAYHKVTTCPHMDGRKAFDDCIDFMRQQEPNKQGTECITKAYQFCKNKFANKEPMKFM